MPCDLKSLPAEAAVTLAVSPAHVDKAPNITFLHWVFFQRQPLQVTKQIAGLILLPTSIVIQESTKDMQIFSAFSKK